MFRLSISALLSSVFMSLAFVTVVQADDRELLRDTTADPYVFIVMDNSGSMHRSAPCDALDAALDIDPWDGVCTSVCPLDDASCAEVCPNWGCIEYSVDADEDDMIEITVDNADATLEGAAANWTLDLDTYTTKIGDDFAYVPEGSTGAIVFEADLPEDGEYHVFLQSHRIRNNDEAIDARVTITHGEGSNYQEVDMESREISSQFNYLGSFNFLAAQTAIVRVDNETTGDEIFDQSVAADGTPQAIIADAVRFYRMPEPAGGLTSTMCTAEGWRCEQPLCPQGGCQVPRGADDPTSKFFQAKQALYEVLGEVEGVHFGFSTYEQDDSALIYKHYLMRVRETQEDGTTPQQTFNSVLAPADQLQGFDWPMIGAYEVFGTGAPYDNNGNATDQNLRQDNIWNCGTDFDDQRGDSGFEDDHWIGCTPGEPADVEDVWELARFMRIPRLGRTASSETRLYIRDIDDTVYRIDTEFQGFNDGLSSPAYSYGDPVFGVQFDLHRCTNAACTSSDELWTNMDVWYDFAGEYSDANFVLSRRNNPTSYFQRNSSVYNQIMAETPGTACFDRGLEPNSDLFYDDEPYDEFVNNLEDDAWWDYAHKWPWRFDDRGSKNVDGMALTGISNGDSFFYDGNRQRVHFMDYGDFIPLDWETRNIDIIRRHLAPNAWEVTSGEDPDESITSLTPTGELPDFRTAVYFKDTYDENPSNNRRRLRLKDESERPMLASGMTPLNGALTDFQLWYQGGPNQSCDLDPGENPIGWCQYAAVFDLNWNCKQKFVLMITDGDETCDLPGTGENYPACDTAADLLGDGIRTFVVGFGLPELEEANALQCMAEQGGTGDPILPKNKDELVEALLALFSQVKAEQRSFASASIPAVQSSASDKVYLSSFFPVPGVGFWPGRIDVFRQPLPLTDDLRPDVSATCSDDRQSSCHLYDVAERILAQAPDDDTIDNESLPTAERFNIQIGSDDVTTSDPSGELITSVGSRRVFYGMNNPSADRTQPLRLLWPNDYDDPNGDLFRLDLAEVMVPTDEWVEYNTNIAACDPDVADCSSIEEELDDDLQFTVAQLLRKKQHSLLDAEGEEIQCTGDPENTSEPCTYVMGDVFHANPQVIASANDFDFFRQDLCGTPLPDGTPTSCVPADNFSSAAEMRDRGYREYTRRTTWRRRMLATATNDGQLHFFDAGKYIQVEDPSDATNEIDVFTDGTGYELFSYIPRMMTPIIRDQANKGDEEVADKHIFSMDGSPKTADVFIDPLPDTDGNYEVAQREWRTVMIGGVREAGDIFDQTNHVLDFRSGYYALDISFPDPMVPATDSVGNEISEFAPWVPKDPGKFLPQCLAASTETGLQTTVTGCETQAGEAVPFPLELWTFQDTIEVDGIRYPLDEDINGFRDLGDTWSTPVIGQIMVCNGGNQCKPESSAASDKTDLETRWVAIFGGGMDPVHKNNPVLGDWIYFLDIETGEVIYKRQLDGAVPSDPAVLDTNNDGILDLVYIGTTAGKLYKIDLTARETSGKVPSIRAREIGDAKIVGWEDLDYTVDPPVPVPDPSERKFEIGRIIHPAWDPFVIFDVGEPIYYPPALFRIPELEQYGFTIATGDREDLWEENGEIGYFITAVDESFTSTTPGLPVTIADLARFPWDSTEGVYTDGVGDEQTILAEETIDLLTNSPANRRGWAMEFPEEFRSTGEPFVLSGILVFSMFEPLNFTVEDLGSSGGVGVDATTVCSRSGTTYAFVVFLNSSAPLLVEEEEGLDDDGGGAGGGDGDCDGCTGGGGGSGTSTNAGSTCGGRCEVINEFTTAIHTESSVTKNPISNDEDGDQTQTSANRPQTEREKALANEIREAVLDLSPRTCQFNQKYEMLISALRNSTGLNVYARVPLLVCPGDWKN